MLLDVNSPYSGESINRGDPSSSYTSSYLNRTFAVVEAFKNYPNTLLFFAGNEVINDVPSGKTIPPYMRVSLLPQQIYQLSISNVSRPLPETSRITSQNTPLEVFLLDTVLLMYETTFSIPGIIFSALLLVMLLILLVETCLLSIVTLGVVILRTRRVRMINWSRNLQTRVFRCSFRNSK